MNPAGEVHTGPTQRRDGASKVGQHYTRDRRATHGPQARLSVPTAQARSTWNAGSGASQAPGSYFCAWVFLAPTPMLAGRPTARNEPCVLGRQVTAERQARHRESAAAATNGLAGADSVGVPNRNETARAAHPEIPDISGNKEVKCMKGGVERKLAILAACWPEILTPTNGPTARRSASRPPAPPSSPRTDGPRSPSSCGCGSRG